MFLAIIVGSLGVRVSTDDGHGVGLTAVVVSQVDSGKEQRGRCCDDLPELCLGVGTPGCTVSSF